MGALPWPPSQQQPDSQSPQETDLQQPTPTGGGSGFLQPQRTGPQGPVNQQQQQSGGVPPVPPIPQNSQSQFQQQRPQLQLPQPQFGQNGSVSGVAAQRRFLSPSPGLGGQLTLTAQHTALNGSGIGGIRPLVSQPTRFNDPRMQMMSSTFMPTSIQAPSGAPQSSGGPPSSQSLQQPSQQHNQAQRGTSTSKAPWVVSKEERKDYDQIFYTWDLSNSGFIDRGTATEVFSQSGLDRNALAQIWVLADAENRGKLNIQEFHVAMGLIYRRLNGNEIPPILPLEMEPVSSKHLSESVDFLKDLFKNDTNVRATASESENRQDGRDRDRHYYRRASPALVYSPASPSPPTSSTVNEARRSAAAPAPTAALPAPPTKNMTAEERIEYYRRQAQQRLQDRMKALGLGGPAPSSSPPVNTSVEDRLERERKEAEVKALQAERDAEERERARKERLGALRPSPLKKLALHVPAAQKPPPPPPPPRPKAAPSAILKPAPPAAVPQPVSRASKIVVPVEEKRRREEIAKRRVARLAELQRLEEEEEHQKRIEALEAKLQEEEEHQKRIEALKAKLQKLEEEEERQKRIEAFKASLRERMASSSPSSVSAPARPPSVPVTRSAGVRE